MNIKDSKVTIFVVIGIIAIVGVTIYAITIDKNINSNNSDGITNPSIATNETLDPPAVSDLTEEEKSAAEIRDQQRIKDVNDIKLALDEFVNANGYYPGTIDELIPNYISEMPLDPIPESYEYNYTCIGSTDPCVFYDLSYTLEIGTEELAQGINLISPDEIAKQ